MDQRDNDQASSSSGAADPYTVAEDKLEGLVFDCDGTLVDTMPFHFAMWKKAMQKYGIDISEERFYQLGGVPALETVRIHIKEKQAKDSQWKLPEGITAEIMAEAKNKLCAANEHLQKLEAISEVVDIAKRYHKRVPMAVCSGSNRREVAKAIRAIGAEHLFDTLVTSDDYEHGKPHPEPYLLAAKRLGIDPSKMRGFEDTDIGLQSIRAAGMEAVDIRPIIRSQADGGEHQQ